MEWTIIPIMAGEFGMVRDDIKFVNGDPTIAEMVPSLIFALKSSLGTVLVDTSFGDAEHCAKILKLEVIRKPTYREILMSYLVEPEEVRAIILTHLDWDHADNLGFFPSSAIYCQKREMDSFIGHDDSYIANIKENCDRMLLIEGDQEILPGIKVHLAGGHTEGLQMVLVNTSEGMALIPSDNIMTYKNIEENIRVGLCKDPIACEMALDWARSVSKIVYPSHDYRTVGGKNE
jgi:glyoxylase-like metal-dependent hydrolase (beta-lactamase superfamily II)